MPAWGLNLTMTVSNTTLSDIYIFAIHMLELIHFSFNEEKFLYSLQFFQNYVHRICKKSRPHNPYSTTEMIYTLLGLEPHML